MKNGNDNKKKFGFSSRIEDNLTEKKRPLRFDIELNQYRYFKALLTLRDLTFNDFFNVFFKSVMDEDERILSMIEEADEFKKNKLISKLSNPDKDDLYDIIEQDSPLDAGGDGKEEEFIIEQDWGKRTKGHSKRYSVEISSRDKEF
jgi:hypothetical protein